MKGVLDVVMAFVGLVLLFPLLGLAALLIKLDCRCRGSELKLTRLRPRPEEAKTED